jgi:hypothetical protein
LKRKRPFVKPNGARATYSDAATMPKRGIDPEWGRKVDVDLSPERMAKAWEAYKLRWAWEEQRLKDLEERKIVSKNLHNVLNGM